MNSCSARNWLKISIMHILHIANRKIALPSSWGLVMILVICSHSDGGAHVRSRHIQKIQIILLFRYMHQKPEISLQNMRTLNFFLNII